MKYLLVTGGRAYADRAHVFAELDRRQPDLVLHGGAKTWDRKRSAMVGADHFAGEWADERGKPCIVMPAPWKGLGKAAGPRRNGWLLAAALRLAKDHAHLSCLAFPGDSGTADMKRRCLEAGLLVEEVQAPAGQPE